jgi:hypothetical protein
MAHTDDMVNVAECELQELVGEYAASICKAEQTVICKDGPQAHGPGMQNSFVAQATKASMAMYDLDSFADHNVAEDGKEGEDSGERRLAVDDQEGDIVDLEAICKVSHACSASVGVSDDNDLVAPIDEFLYVCQYVQDG